MKDINWTEDEKKKIIFRFTALWAFIESGIGGLLHLIQVPFSGVLLTGFSILIICLIYIVSNFSSREVLKSLTLVLLIKLTLSPHTPFTAYIAVCFQAIISLIFFKYLRINFISIFIVSILTYWESAFQKVLVLTILFGTNLFSALDDFAHKYLGNILPFLAHHASTYLLLIYLAVYTISAIIMAFLIYKVTQFIGKEKIYLSEIGVLQIDEQLNSLNKFEHSSKGSGIIILISLFVILLSAMYLIYDLNKVVYYLLRTVIVFILWFFILVPFLNYLVKLILRNKQVGLSQQMQETLLFFPKIRLFIRQAYYDCKEKRYFNKWTYFFEKLILLLIFK